jgi:hypothetical protein
MAVYHGRKGLVYLSTTGTGNAVSVGKLTAWTLNQGQDKIDVTSFGDANKTYVVGLKDVSGTFEGFWQDSDETIFTAADSSDGVKMYLYPSSNALSKYFYGPAWIDTSISAGVAAAVAISGTFSANGAWGRR